MGPSLIFFSIRDRRPVRVPLTGLSDRPTNQWPMKVTMWKLHLKEEEENENGPIRNDPEDSNGSDENLENPVFMNNNQNFQYQRWVNQFLI